MDLLTHAENRRVLSVDDSRDIHSDDRKSLCDHEVDTELSDMEAMFLGGPVDEAPRLNLTLESAYQGEEALEMVTAAVQQGQPYALAFVDMRMPPGWDGLETIERLWQVDPELHVVICSAYSDQSWGGICQRLIVESSC